MAGVALFVVEFEPGVTLAPLQGQLNEAIDESRVGDAARFPQVGYMLILVSWGMELSSFTRTFCRSVRKKSTRAIPSHSRALKAWIASF